MLLLSIAAARLMRIPLGVSFKSFGNKISFGLSP
jgi:hypothetical protein